LRAVLERHHLEQRLELIAAAHVALEVHVPAEQLDQADDDVVRQGRALRRHVQAVVDDAGVVHQVASLRPRHLGGGIAPVGAAGHPHRMVEVDVEIERHEAALARLGRAMLRPDQQFLPGAQPARVVHLLQRLYRRMRLRLRNAGAGQNVHESVAAAHGDLLGRPLLHAQLRLGRARLARRRGAARQAAGQSCDQHLALGPERRPVRVRRFDRTRPRAQAGIGGLNRPGLGRTPARRLDRRVDPIGGNQGKRRARAGFDRNVEQPSATHAGAEADRERQQGGHGQKMAARHAGHGRAEQGSDPTWLSLSPAPAAAARPALQQCFLSQEMSTKP
jgi:hypothetical protein